MNRREPNDEALEAMLNAEDPYLDDAGFTAKVMHRLPPRRRAASPVRSLILLGSSGAAALVMLLNQPLCAEVSRAFAGLSNPSALSLSTLPVVSMVMVATLLWAGFMAVGQE